MTSSTPIYRMLKDKSNVATPHAMDHDTVYREPPFNAENIAPAPVMRRSFTLGNPMVQGAMPVQPRIARRFHEAEVYPSAIAWRRLGGPD